MNPLHNGWNPWPNGGFGMLELDPPENPPPLFGPGADIQNVPAQCPHDLGATHDQAR